MAPCTGGLPNNGSPGGDDDPAQRAEGRPSTTELRPLNDFIAVAEERHFGRAAERLHMAQPPLSQQIRRLEEQLGARRLDRTTRRVDLTAAGRVLLDRGRRIVGELEHAPRLEPAVAWRREDRSALLHHVLDLVTDLGDGAAAVA